MRRRPGAPRLAFGPLRRREKRVGGQRTRGHLGRRQHHATAAAGGVGQAGDPHRRESSSSRRRGAKLERGAATRCSATSYSSECARRQAAIARTTTETGNYNGFWCHNRDIGQRHVAIIRPAGWRILPRRRRTQARRAAADRTAPAESADGPESRGLSERCSPSRAALQGGL